MTLLRLALLAAALVIAFAAWVLWPERSSSGGTGAVLRTQPVAPAVSAAPPIKPRIAGTTPPLPPADTPLKEMRDSLVSRALAGDATAACRWAMELERCPSIQAIKHSLKRAREEQQDEHASPYRRSRATETVVRLEERLALTERVCEGVSPAESKVAWKFLLSAAQAGHVPSMLFFADGSAMREHIIPSRSEAAEAWTLHKQLAPGFLARAVERGNPYAVFMTALAYEKGNWFGEPLLPQDRSLALAHWQALASVAVRDYADSLQQNISKLRDNPPMTPQELAHTQKLSEQIAERLRAANVRELDYRISALPGGKIRHCE